VANRLLGNGCFYVSNFRHSKVLIIMNDRAPLLLAPRYKFVTLNIFDRNFSVDFPARGEYWSTECVDLVAPDGLIFLLTAGVFSDILNGRESYALGSTVFQSEVYAILASSEYCISEGIVNRTIGLLCCPLNRMPCLSDSCTKVRRFSSETCFV
jgi:hypothetical protein